MSENRAIIPVGQQQYTIQLRETDGFRTLPYEEVEGTQKRKAHRQNISRRGYIYHLLVVGDYKTKAVSAH
jgi:hypothetical protein